MASETELEDIGSKAIIISIQDPQDQYASLYLKEFQSLVQTALFEIEETFVQKKRILEAQTAIGLGKIEEIKPYIQLNKVKYALCDRDLRPIQVKNLEKMMNLTVIDRTGIILTIFSRRAKSYKSKLQVQLAQCEYEMSRLTGMWEHFGKIRGGIGVKGMGETQLEVDKRLMKDKIKRLENKIKSIGKQREDQLLKKGEVVLLTLVGYTNAGKSTLLNDLCKDEQKAGDQLFLTLDSVRRQMHVDISRKVLLSDTVGFISDLPAPIQTAFHSTLHETVSADLLIHVVDTSDPLVFQKKEAVEKTLIEMGAFYNKKKVLIGSKIDQDQAISLEDDRYDQVYHLSVKTQEGIDKLKKYIEKFIYKKDKYLTLKVDPCQTQYIQQIYRLTSVLKCQEIEEGLLEFDLRVAPYAYNQLMETVKKNH